jgi:hypothetical protein
MLKITEKYTHSMESTIFTSKNDEFYATVIKNVEEASGLLEA